MSLVAQHLGGPLLTEVTWDDGTQVAIALVGHPDEARKMALEQRLPCGIGSAVDAAGLRQAVPESVAALFVGRAMGASGHGS